MRTPLVGFDLAQCEVASLIPLTTSAVCGNTSLERTTQKKVPKISKLLGKAASSEKPSRRKRSVKKATRQLLKIQRKAQKLRKKGKVSGECVNAIASQVATGVLVADGLLQ